MRQFNKPSQDIVLFTEKRTLHGGALRLELKDCAILIPQIWVKRTKRSSNGALCIFISSYWAETIANKIRAAGGNLGKYPSVLKLSKLKRFD